MKTDISLKAVSDLSGKSTFDVAIALALAAGILAYMSGGDAHAIVDTATTIAQNADPVLSQIQTFIPR